MQCWQRQPPVLQQPVGGVGHEEGGEEGHGKGQAGTGELIPLPTVTDESPRRVDVRRRVHPRQPAAYSDTLQRRQRPTGCNVAMR